MEKSYWSQYVRPACYPKCNCETIRDEWVVQPSATLSSLPLILLGIWIVKKSWKLDPKLIMLGINVIFLGIASTLAHGTFTAIALHLDFLGILFCLTWMGLYCSGLKFDRIWVGLWISLTALSFSITYLFENIRIFFCIIYFVIVFIVWLKWYRRNNQVKKYFKYSYSILAISAFLFLLDEQRIWCSNPDGWFLGHSLWHLGVCLSLWFSFQGLYKLHRK